MLCAYVMMMMMCRNTRTMIPETKIPVTSSKSHDGVCWSLSRRPPNGGGGGIVVVDIVKNNLFMELPVQPGQANCLSID